MSAHTKPSPLKAFKQVLLPGARFVIQIEPVVIRGNLGSTLVPGGTGQRQVVSVDARKVVFLTETGGNTSFQFPPAHEMASPEEGVFSWNPNGKTALTYRQVA